MAKIPQYGDPELLPRPVVTRPSSRKLPYGPSGVLLPEGPEFDVSRDAPDLVGLPYERLANDEWTTPEQRTVILEFIKQFFADNPGVFATWKVQERDRHLRDVAARTPFIHLFVTRRSDRKVFDVAMYFTAIDRKTLEAFQSQMSKAGPVLLALHQQSPEVEGC